MAYLYAFFSFCDYIAVMRVVKVIVVLLLVLFAATGIGVVTYLNSVAPTYSGDLHLTGLEYPVEVYYDPYGVPHIYAETEADLYRAFGYVHAQDRLWQMELMRRIAPGRLSELFGDALLETDKFFRTTGIDQYSRKTASKLDQISDNQYVKNIKSYLDGVNEFQQLGPTPVEYSVLGLEKEPFTIVDVENIMGYMAFSFAVAHKTDPIVQYLYTEHGPEYLESLDLDVDPGTQLIKSFQPEQMLAIQQHVEGILAPMPVGPWIGSNSWIVGPAKSESGAVLFANDPHIAFSQPTVWYEAHLELPDWQQYGHFIALQPFGTLLFNQHHAIGLTMFENDDIDFYHLQPAENGYMYDGEIRPFAVREEVIMVRDAEPVTIEVRSTVHGPVMTDVMDVDYPLAMWWEYLRHESNLQSIVYGLGRATTVNEVEAQVAKIHAPGLNVMYGDSAGNIAWWAAAKLPIRPEKSHSKMILDGTDSSFEPEGYLPFEKNPQAINPPWGYVYSANNQPDSAEGGLYPGYYLPEARAKRIVSLLESKETHSVTDFKSMLLDNRSLEADVVGEILAELVGTDREYMQALASWDGSHGGDRSEPVMYHKLLFRTLEAAMADELGDSFEGFVETHLFKRSVVTFISDADSPWWDDIRTDEIETREQIVHEAYLQSVNELQDQFGDEPWVWKEVHTLEHRHPLGEVEVLRSYFNVGPFAVGASSGVLNNLMFTANGTGAYTVHAGPSTRRIVDFSNINQSMTVSPTGQSGNPMSEHYQDQAEMFIAGEFRPTWINRESIVNNSEKLILSPR